MANLVIVESPSKAKTLKNYLGASYVIMASKGHVRDLPAARLSVDVKKDFEPKYSIVKGKESLVKELKEAVKDSDKVFLATDPDREGEAISWHLAEILGLDLSEANRVTFNEITKTGVKNGMANPRKVDIDLVNAQQARRILDRLVGYKLSPFVSQKIRRGLSAGRVQSVAVRMIVDRENEIRAFNPEEYWSLDGKFTLPGRKVLSASFYGDETGKIELKTEAETDAVMARLEGADYYISSLKNGTRKKNPAPPFITSTMQQEASRKLGMRPERTMKVAQELYEGINIPGYGSTGLITYMRTDSLRISEEARQATDKFIRANYGEKYIPEKPRYYKSRSNAQDGHEAIRPSDVAITPESIKASLTAEQYKLYSLIWKRFVASLMASCVQNTTKLEIKSKNAGESEERFCLFTASGYTVKFDGFTVLYNVDEDETSKLPEGISKDSALKFKDLIKQQHFTQPPARYTEESLIKTLEENGVGRPSTYATIISTIVKREYVSRKSKQLIPTELGEAIVNLLKEKFKNIVNVKFTAQMESNLDAVGEGEEDYIKMLHTFYDDFEANLQRVKDDMQGVKIQLKEDITDIPCEKCGKMMVVKVGRFGKFLACPAYPECKTTKPFVVETDASCPVCGGKVISKKSKRGYTFFGCDKWPECSFMTWDKPTNEKCPKCGKSLFKGKGSVLSCLDEKCGYKATATKKKKGE
ncbi:MAG: type I DNA topoisomerase [Clostridia bacterium]|nr:type I DNA topoisomerase [Clostridia bacterium]